MTQTLGPQQQTGWIPDDSTFGARLALIRQGRKWRNVKMAALACGVPVATWRSWEERTTPGLPRELERVRQIADAAGVDYMWLLTGATQGGGGGEEVRHQGLEPRTRWFGPDRTFLLTGNNVISSPRDPAPFPFAPAEAAA